MVIEKDTRQSHSVVVQSGSFRSFSQPLTRTLKPVTQMVIEKDTRQSHSVVVQSGSFRSFSQPLTRTLKPMTQMVIEDIRQSHSVVVQSGSLSAIDATRTSTTQTFRYVYFRTSKPAINSGFVSTNHLPFSRTVPSPPRFHWHFQKNDTSGWEGEYFNYITCTQFTLMETQRWNSSARPEWTSGLSTTSTRFRERPRYKFERHLENQTWATYI